MDKQLQLLNALPSEAHAWDVFVGIVEEIENIKVSEKSCYCNIYSIQFN